MRACVRVCVRMRMSVCGCGCGSGCVDVRVHVWAYQWLPSTRLGVLLARMCEAYKTGKPLTLIPFLVKPRYGNFRQQRTQI